jgi:hypothetical protein
MASPAIAAEAFQEALRKIRKIVHTPTRDTPYRHANDHFQADFDAIRKIVDAVLAEDEAGGYREE